jgi:hypothetical protein
MISELLVSGKILVFMKLHASLFKRRHHTTIKGWMSAGPTKMRASSGKCDGQHIFVSPFSLRAFLFGEAKRNADK